MTSHKFDPRSLMQMAIQAMRASNNEHRHDGKACPLVGAVIWMPDGRIQTAHRGELRAGDHAEYTLIERKNRDQKLDDAVLFATLEPCAPDARKPPKLSCAERIVNARIKRVWVGIEDPDPAVDRKGIQYLQDNGVEVQMFDRDLQAEINKLNGEFIAQAKERATAAKAKPQKAVKLSKLEDVVPHASLEDLSREALGTYRDSLGIRDGLGSTAFNRRLAQHGLLKESDGHLVPTGWGAVLFGKTPRAMIPQCGLLATIHYADGTEETKEFDGPTIGIPEKAEKWLRNKLPNVIDRSQGMERQEKPALPFELLREALVNALVHRDYDIKGAKCQLIVTPDTVVVKSPGAPVSPITLRQLQEFKAPMLSRNPEAHYVFSKVGLAEERGLGLKTFGATGKRGLPLPTYSFDDPYLTLTIFLSSHSATTSLPQDVLASLTKEEQAGFAYLATQGTVKKTEYAEHFGFDARKAQRHLSKLVLLGVVERIGASSSTAYRIKS